MNIRIAGAALVVGVICLGVGGCGGRPTEAAPSAATSSTASAAPVRAGELVFEDSFEDDRNGWGVIDDPQNGTTKYAGGDYVWAFSGSMAHWLAEVVGKQYDSGTLDMLDVVVTAEATIESGKGVVGVFCRENPDTDAEWQWYEFVARDGFAAIRQGDAEGNLKVLAKTDSVHLPTGQPIAFEAVCANGNDGAAQLSLSLNGSSVLQATAEDPLKNGVAGLQAYTYPLHALMNIRWHDFAVHRAATQ